MLLFKARYKEDILNGSKTTTMRSWKRNLVKPGTVRMTNLRIPLFIESVDKINLDDITDAHAQADGFNNRDELMIALYESYKVLPETLTLVKFHVAE